MATHSSILAGDIPWAEDPGGLGTIGLQRVRHYWSDLACMNTLHFNFRRKIICCWSIHVWGVMHDWQCLTLSIRVYLKYLLQKLFLRSPRLCPSGRSVAHPPLLWTGIREQRALHPGTRGTTRKAAAPSPVTHRTLMGKLVLHHS